MITNELKKGIYTREEIGAFFGIKLSDPRFKKKVEQNLIDYDYIYKKKGVIINGKKEYTGDKKILHILKRDYNLIPYSLDFFCSHIYLLYNDEDYNCCAWEERSRILKEQYDIIIPWSTLRSWTLPLINTDNTIVKSKDKDQRILWRTEKTYDGGTIRYMLFPEDDPEEYEKGQQYIKKLWQGYYKGNPHIFKELWNQYKCYYYYSYPFVFNAFANQELLNMCLEKGLIFLTQQKTKVQEEKMMLQEIKKVLSPSEYEYWWSQLIIGKTYGVNLTVDIKEKYQEISKSK